MSDYKLYTEDYVRDIADALRSKYNRPGDPEKYTIRQMAGAVNNLSLPEPLWSEIGYSGAPQIVLDSFDYAKYIYDNWDPSVTYRRAAFKADVNMRFFPFVDTSNVTDMQEMFSYCSWFCHIEEDTDFSSVTNIKSMFSNCLSLEYIKLSKLSSGSARSINASYFADNCTTLKAVEMDCKHVVDLSYAFCTDKQLECIDLGDTSKVTNMECAFQLCWKLPAFDFEPDFSSVINMNTFLGETRAWNSDITWNLPECTTAHHMLARCGTDSDLSSQNAYHVKLNMPKLEWADSICYEVEYESHPLLSFELTSSSALKSLASAFTNCWNMTKCYISDTSSVGKPSWSGDGNAWQSTFYECQHLVDLGELDMSYAGNINQCFFECKSLVTLATTSIVGSKRGSGIYNCSAAFQKCTNLRDIPVFKMDGLTQNGGNMFAECPSLSDQSLDNLLVSLMTATNYTTKTLYHFGLRETDYPESRLETLDHWDDFLTAGWTTGY